MDNGADALGLGGSEGTTDFDFGTPVTADFLDFGSSTSGGSDAGSSRSDSGGDGSGTDGFDPAIHVSRDKRNADGSYTRKRGRKSSGNSASSGSRSKASNKAGVESLTRMIALLHMGIAGVTKTPEFVLEDAEAETLASATTNVLIEFDIRPDPKAEAIFGLVTAVGMVYGPRVYLIRKRKKMEKE